MSISVVIADDHRIMLEGLSSLIMEQVDMNVAGRATDGREAVKLTSEVNPDVVIMDLTMPSLNGIEAIRAIKKDNRHVRIIALSMHSEKRFIRAAFEAGASGYVVKENAFEELVKAIRSVHEDGRYLCPVATRSMMIDYLHYIKNDEGGEQSGMLTPREREILQMLAEGNKTREIAGTLHVSVKTVETHRKNIMDKLGLKNIAELTRYAIREGIIPA